MIEKRGQYLALDFDGFSIGEFFLRWNIRLIAFIMLALEYYKIIILNKKTL